MIYLFIYSNFVKSVFFFERERLTGASGNDEGHPTAHTRRLGGSMSD